MVYKTPEEVKAKVEALVTDTLNVPPEGVRPGSRFQIEVGVSLEVIEFYMACEEEFNIEVSDEDIESCPTVGDFTLYVQRKLGLAAD